MMRFRSSVRIAIALCLVALWMAGDLSTPLQARVGLEPGGVRGLEPGRVGRVGGPRVDRDVYVDRDVHVHGRRGYGGYHPRAEFWDEVDDERDQRTAVALIGGLVIGAMVASPPKNSQPVAVSGQQYYYSEGNYYQPSGNQYQVVAPPMGAEVYNLPAGAQRFDAGGATYFEAGGAYYQLYYRGGEPIYQVVPNPLG